MALQERRLWLCTYYYMPQSIVFLQHRSPSSRQKEREESPNAVKTYLPHCDSVGGGAPPSSPRDLLTSPSPDCAQIRGRFFPPFHFRLSFSYCSWLDGSLLSIDDDVFHSSSPLLPGCAVLQALANGEEGGGGSASLLPPLLAASSLSIARRFFSCLFPLFASQMPVTRPTGLQVPTVYQPFVTFLEKPNTKLIFLGHLIFARVGNAEVFPTDDLVICIWRLLCFGPINCTFPPCF